MPSGWVVRHISEPDFITGIWTEETPVVSFIGPVNFDSPNSVSGSVSIAVDDEIRLYDEDKSLIDSFTKNTLPLGFQITEFTVRDFDFLGFQNFPNAITSLIIDDGNNYTPGSSTSFTTSFGVSNSSYNVTPERVSEFLDPFTILFNATVGPWTGIGTGGFLRFYFQQNFAWLPPAPDYFIFARFEYPDGPPLGPIENPKLVEPMPSIEVTPPPETTIVEVEVPGEPIIEEPVTPGVPIVIPLPPGATVVKVTPKNPGVNAPGPTTIIPVDLDQEEPIVIDLVLNFGIQLIANPAGIYTLVPGKTNDTLYERVAGTTTATSQVVAIPRPFGITNYIPEE